MWLRPLSERDPPVLRFAAALAIAAITLGGRWLLDPLLGSRQHYLAPTVTAALATWLCGVAPGILATAAATAASLALFVAPRYQATEGIAGPLAGNAVSLTSIACLVFVVAVLKRFQREAQSQAESAREAELQAKRRDAYLREFIDHTSAVVYVKDLEGRYLLVNDRFGALVPEMKDRWQGTRVGDWLPPESADRVAAIDARVIESGESHTFEETVTLPEGPRTWVAVKFPIVDERGKTVAVGGVSTEVTELHNARAHLERTEQVLRNLIDVQEQEKQLLCSEFHDGLIQYAVGAKMLLESLDRAGLAPADAASLGEAIDALSRGIEDGRRVIHGIRPAELDDLGLAAAIQSLVDDMEAAGIEVAATIDPGPGPLPPAFQVTAYRIVQEALSNVRRHSESRTARLRVTREGGALVVVVADDGVGFDGRLPGPRGFGITGMAERARLAGGDCVVEGVPGVGTTVTARLPIPAEAVPGAHGADRAALRVH